VGDGDNVSPVTVQASSSVLSKSTLSIERLRGAVTSATVKERYDVGFVAEKVTQKDQ
jgi:hypothetical protein